MEILLRVCIAFLAVTAVYIQEGSSKDPRCDASKAWECYSNITWKAQEIIYHLLQNHKTTADDVIQQFSRSFTATSGCLAFVAGCTTPPGGNDNYNFSEAVYNIFREASTDRKQVQVLLPAFQCINENPPTGFHHCVVGNVTYPPPAKAEATTDTACRRREEQLQKCIPEQLTKTCSPEAVKSAKDLFSKIFVRLLNANGCKLKNSASSPAISFSVLFFALASLLARKLF